MIRNIGIALLTLLVATAMAATREYDVDVYRNFNGKARGADGVTESFVNTADSLLWAEFFVGAANSGGHYYLQILPMGSNDPLYTGNAHAGDSIHYQYIRANLSRYSSEPLVKGKEYVLKVTCTAPNESLNWYADTTNPYAYGRMFVGGDAPLRWDLCARIEGVNRAVSQESAKEPVSQPDLSVDSVWVTQGSNAQVTLHARVGNIGTGDFASVKTGCCVRFAIDGDPVNAAIEPAKLKVGGIAVVTSVPVSPDRSVMHLVSAEANPNKEVMEPNFDNNARYCPLSAR